MKLAKAIEESIEVQRLLLADSELMENVESSVAVISEALRRGNRVHFCGNGGSAADAQHLAAELSGRFYKDRPPLNAEALHCNTSYVTAVGNDYGFEHIYARLIEGTGRRGDVLVVLSTSGNSPNIIEACKAAKKKEIPVIALTGKTGGKLRGWADILVAVPSQDTPRIQETHILLGHCICEEVEKELFFSNE